MEDRTEVKASEEVVRRWISFAEWRMEVMLLGKEYPMVIFPNVHITTDEGTTIKAEYMVCSSDGERKHILRYFDNIFGFKTDETICVRDHFEGPGQLAKAADAHFKELRDARRPEWSIDNVVWFGSSKKDVIRPTGKAVPSWTQYTSPYQFKKPNKK